MSDLSALVKRAKKFSTADLADKSKLSKRTINYLIAGKTGVTLHTAQSFEMAVKQLEKKAEAKATAKSKSSRKADKKQTQSRDTGRRSVANNSK